MSEQPPPPPPGGRWMRNPDGQWQWVPDQQEASWGPPPPPPNEQPPSQSPLSPPPGHGGSEPIPPPKRPNWIVRHPYWSVFIALVVIGGAATGGGVSGTSSGSHSASAVASSPSPGDGGIPSDLPTPPTDTGNLPSTLPSESPSVSPSPSPSPSPPPKPKPKPKPPVAKYSGVGDDVISIRKPASVDLVTATSTGGENNFVIEAKGPNDDDQLLVNTIGNYHGTTLMDAQQGEESTTLQISATGPWSIILRPTWTAQRYAGGTFNGTGDSAVIVSDPSLFKATFSGPPTEDNFVVEEYTNDGDDNLLVNVVNANYNGTVPMSPPSLIMITAAGPWSMSTS